MGEAVIIEYASIEPVPWKNGRGVTRNLFDDGGENGEWSWRVSIAEISGEQPYSSFPGVRRTQVSLGPGGVDLTIDGSTSAIPPGGVISFDGEAEVSARPECAGFLDLNIMVRRSMWAAEVETIEGPVLASRAHGTHGAPSDSGFSVLVALDDGCTLGRRTLRRLDAALLSRGATPGLGGRFAVARFARVAA